MTKEERVDELKVRIGVMNDQIKIYKNSLENAERYISEYKQELANLQAQQKPKYSAKDFPCLGYLHNQNIIYKDGENNYLIAHNYKQISHKDSTIFKHLIANELSIDQNIDIVECKLLDIKEGDYFAYTSTYNYEEITSYRYCKQITNGTYYFDYGARGYIEYSSMNNSIKPDKFIKFILKKI